MTVCDHDRAFVVLTQVFADISLVGTLVDKPRAKLVADPSGCLLHTASEWNAISRSSAVVRPYMDRILRTQREKYVEFVGDMWNSGMLSSTLSPKDFVCPFFSCVKKTGL